MQALGGGKEMAFAEQWSHQGKGLLQTENVC